MAIKKIKLRLQGHEKFGLREGWINKGLQIIPNVPNAFLRKDSTDLFGIGSNMVKSLRYWMKALGLVIESNSTGAVLTNLGELVREYDPYIEDPFTLWIMHSHIAKNKEEATSWYMYFNHCDADDLDKNEIETILNREITKYSEGQSFSEKSLCNDIDVLLNMYSKNNDKTDPEDKSISPFSKLELIKNTDGRYVKKHPNKKFFSEMIVLYELAIRLEDRPGISMEEIIFGKNGLANIYNMSSVMANDYFDRLDATGYIRVNRTAGLDMIYSEHEICPMDVIKDYYKNC